MPAPLEMIIGIDNNFVTVSDGSPFEDQGAYGFSVDSQGYVIYDGKYIYYNGSHILGTDYPYGNRDYFTIQTLAGTKWVINKTPSKPNSDINCSINFNSDGEKFTSIVMYSSNVMWMSEGITYDSDIVYNPFSDDWSSQSYRIISITEGTDVTNSDLISWLMNNATQVPVVDLSRTEWVFNEEPNLTGLANVYYYINFTSNSNIYTDIILTATTIRYYDGQSSTPTLVYQKEAPGEGELS